jgi:hypothetical protein
MRALDGSIVSDYKRGKVVHHLFDRSRVVTVSTQLAAREGIDEGQCRSNRLTAVILENTHKLLDERLHIIRHSFGPTHGGVHHFSFSWAISSSRSASRLKHLFAAQDRSRRDPWLELRFMKSWKSEVIADSSGEWCSNALCFATRQEA